MASLKYGREKLILHIAISLWNILLANSETTETIISIRYESTSNNFLQASVSTSTYLSFHEAFFNSNTTSVFLKHQWDDKIVRIANIEYSHNVNYIDNLYFSCSNNRTSETIKCYRDIRCSMNAGTQTKLSNVCVSGFGISWAYEGEYISSIHLKKSTVKCLNKYTITCYTQVDNGDFKTTERLTTTAVSIVSSMISTHSGTTKTPYSLSLIDILTYSKRFNLSFINSTLPSVEQNPKSSASDSTSVIAGVIVSIIIVIVIVILIAVLYKRKQRQKESANKSKSPNPMTLSDTVYKKQLDQTADQNTDSKNTVRMLSNNGKSKTKSNPDSFTILSDKNNAVRNLPQSISDSEYAVIEESQIVTQTNTSLSAHKDTDAYFNAKDDYQSSFVPEPRTPNIEEFDSSINTYSSDVSEVHSASPQEECTTISEIDDYTIINESDFNINHTAEHEYNNVKLVTTTIASTESTIDVYFNLRENIKHYEHVYVDERAAIKTEEDNSSTLAPDNIYFILETEDTTDVEL